MKSISEFTNLYQLSKTLRFELIPQEKTLEYIQKNGLLENDQQRAESYQVVKKIIDEYHKDFIEKALNGLCLQYENVNSQNSLEEYYHYYSIKQKADNEKKTFVKIQENLRKQIVQRFEKDDACKEQFKRLFAKELIKEDLKSYVKNEEELKVVSEFENFTTYFTGFYENRKNMYKAEEISTAIPYRLIHENLPKFIDNISSFEKVKNTSVAEKFAKLYEDFEMYLNVSCIEDIFTLQSYTDFLSQSQIDVYNAVIGGKTLKDETKIQGLNEYINLYNQQQTDKHNRLPKLKPLFKQILSDRNAISWLAEEFEPGNDTKVLQSIYQCDEDIALNCLLKEVEGEMSLVDILLHIQDFELDKIYIKNDTSLTEISQKIYGDWAIIQKSVEKGFEQNNPKKKNETEESYQERKSKFFKSFDSFSIQYLNTCIELYNTEVLHEATLSPIQSYFNSIGVFKVNDELTKNLFVAIQDAYSNAEELLRNDYPADKDLAQQKDDVAKIKVLLDSIKAIQWFIKPLLGKGNEAEKDGKFYGEFEKLWQTLDQVTPLYNKVRNYMTRKPYSVEKIKLNFENSTLLDGWDVNKESDNTSIILRKDGLYYLAIMDKKHNKVFKKEFASNNEQCFEKMEYKLLPGANKMLPKVFFSNSRINEFNPDKELLSNYENETHKKGEKFNIQHCHKLIDFFKSSINKHEDWKNFEFNFSNTSLYEDLSGFYREVEKQGYKLSFRNIPETYINQLVEEGKLYLFQIYNKDFSPHSKGTPNMHTLYWRMLFDAENLKDVVYKLNGQAEVFYRKSSIKPENIIVHKAQEAIANKNLKNDKQQSVFEYDIIKDKRFTIDKFQFHVPITMNFKGIGLQNINSQTNQYIQENHSDIHVIGIDRGERHLLYLTLINSQGEIVKQFSLNEIVNEYNGKTYTTNYHDLLDAREKARLHERESWKTIETIKELKEGYISQVIHKITELMVQYNAIVVLEDLNMGFMRGRQKVEKQVYQKFEKMLIDKLNYLVDKKKAPTEPGGVLNALQLTNKFESFQKMGKQSGFLFYVPAWNTSKMDPVTGFVNLFDTRYERIDKAQDFFGNFKTIKFNESKQYFEFHVDDYAKFSGRAEGTRQNWILCTYGQRIITYRNPEKNSQWDSKEVDMTQEFIQFFTSKSIDYTATDLQNIITKQTEKEFFEKLLNLFKLTLQMRNSITGTETDYLISPVANAAGEFYDSRKAIDSLPKDADANGAYNIARKGLWVIEQIKQAPDLAKVKLAISNKEWLHYIQK